MDNAILIAVVHELRRDLAGATLGDVVQIDSLRFALRFSSPPFPRLVVNLHPDLSALHRVRRVPTPREPTELAVSLTATLGGCTLEAIRKEEAERSLELDFAAPEGGRWILVLELMGKASNLLLLDSQRRILRFFRSHRGSFRRPDQGALYEPPPPQAAAASPLGSRLLARELELQVARGRREEEILGSMRLRVREGRWDPCLYAPRPPDRISESEDLPGSVCFAAPFPLAVGESLHRTPCASANEAVRAWADLLYRHLLMKGLRDSLGSLLRAEIRRTSKLEETLAGEMRAAAEAAATRRQGEILLASLATARKSGDEVEVTDYFDPSLPRIRLRIDPRRDLKGNAEALFRRARKMERASVAVAGRLERSRERLSRLSTFLRRVEAAGCLRELEEAEEEMNRGLPLRKMRRPEARDPGRRPEFMRVRRFRTGDGRTILVGRSSADNDTVTFRVAGPHDFWFHAAGRPGAHVIVRNPERSKDLPESTKRAAAAVAAWYSRGDRGGEVDVHYARRRDVRKGKGMSPGTVTLRAFRTIRVVPGLPPGAEEG